MSHGSGGRTALNYIAQVRGLDFTEAVGLILRDAPVSSQAQSQVPPARAEPKTLILPERNVNNRRVFAYLRSRGIDPEINMHELTGDFYTVGKILGHSLTGVGIQLGISTSLEATTAQYVNVRMDRKAIVLNTYHNAIQPQKASWKKRKQRKTIGEKSAKRT